MKLRTICREQRITTVAAAVLLALGTGTAAAQQAGQQPSERPSTQQSQPSQSPSSQSPGAQSPSGLDSQSPSDSESRSQQGSSDPSSAQSQTRQQSSSGGSADIEQLSQEHEDLSTFFEAVKAAGMEDSLTAGTDYTLFAPTNDAFEQMSGMSTDELLQSENREQLISLLRAHIVADDVDEQMARSLSEAQTIDGGSVSIDASQDEWRVGDARVVEEGIDSGNLRVYAIDQVLEPTQVARADDFGSPSEVGQGDQQGSSAAGGLDSDSDSQSQRSGAGAGVGSELGAERDTSSSAQMPGSQSGQSGQSRPGAGQQSQSQPGQIQAPGSQSPIADRELDEEESEERDSDAGALSR